LVVHGNIAGVPVRENSIPEVPATVSKMVESEYQVVDVVPAVLWPPNNWIAAPDVPFCELPALKYSGVPVVLVLADEYAEADKIWRPVPGFTSDVGDPI
jgi:hypothetical protein